MKALQNRGQKYIWHRYLQFIVGSCCMAIDLMMYDDLPSGKHTKSCLDNGPVEIVDLPLKMVIFHILGVSHLK